jgi:hypothetical protein
MSQGAPHLGGAPTRSARICAFLAIKLLRHNNDDSSRKLAQVPVSYSVVHLVGGGTCSVVGSFDAFVLGAFFSLIYLLHEPQSTVRLYLHTQERTPIWGITQCHLARASNKPPGIFSIFSLVVREILLCCVVFGALPALPICLPSFLDRGFISFICHSPPGECP